jgi:DNA-binding MarR family transcriptional regulator
MSKVSVADQIEELLTEVKRLVVCLRGRSDLAGDSNGFSGGVAGVLQALGMEGPQTVPEIARRRHTSRQNVQVVVTRLRKTGLVELEGNPAHKRSALVRLTERGKAALSQVQQAESRRLESLLAHLSEEDVVATRRVLSQIRQLLTEPTWNDYGQEQTNCRPTRSAKQVRPGPRQSLPSKAPVVQQTQPEEEEFPLSLL